MFSEETDAAHPGIPGPDLLARSLATTMNTIPVTQLRVLWVIFRSNIHLATDFQFLIDVTL